MFVFQDNYKGNLIYLNNYNFILPNFILVKNILDYEFVKNNIIDNSIEFENNKIKIFFLNNILNINEEINFNKILVCKYFNKYFAIPITNLEEEISYSINHQLEDFKEINKFKNTALYNNKYILILEIEEFI